MDYRAHFGYELSSLLAIIAKKPMISREWRGRYPDDRIEESTHRGIYDRNDRDVLLLGDVDGRNGTTPKLVNEAMSAGSQREMTTNRADWLRHPLVSMVIGFILTGVLGTAITQHFLDQREEEKLRAQMVLDRKQAIQQFSRLNEERKVRAEILVNALRSNPRADGAKDAIQEYEKAYIAWSTERPGTLLLFRDLLSSENYQLVATGFNKSLVGKVFQPIRRCLTTSLGHGDDRVAAINSLEACRIDELLELSSTCSLALAAAVSDLAETRSGWFSVDDIAEIQKQARDSINEQCL